MATVLFPQQWSLWLIVTAWWPFPAVASYVSPPAVSWAQQLYLVGRVGAAGENSTCHLKWTSSQSDEVRVPQRGAEQDGVGGAREVTVTGWLKSITTFDEQAITERHTYIFSIVDILNHCNYWSKLNNLVM